VDVAPVGVVDPRATRELAREQARAHRLPRRMTAREVAGHRQRGEDAADADRLAHGLRL
jgi:hypothetical protein